MKIDPKEVISGWKNFIIKSDIVEEEALRRAKICAECPLIEKKVMLSFIKETNDFKDIEGYRCSICKCPTSALIRSEGKRCSDNPPKW